MMIRLINAAKLVCSLIGALTSGVVLAEGSSELPPTQNLISTTVILVDIVDADNETFTWTGSGTVTVTSPGGANLGVYNSGDTIDPVENGRHTLDLSSDQTGAWDVTVSAGSPIPGRVSSKNWTLDSGSFTEADALNASLYALVPGGATGLSAVIEVKFDGLAGFAQVLGANQDGISFTVASKSAPQSGFSFTPSIPLYLNVPEVATFSTETPLVTNFSTTTNGPGDYVFSFESNAQGTYYILIDLNTDGVYDISSNEVVASGTTSAGSNSNSVPWSGADSDGLPVPPDTYNTAVQLHTGELHYVAGDVETSFEGLRLFELDATLNRWPLRMFWNDSMVQSAAVSMPSGSIGLESSGFAGIDSGNYTDPASPNINARSWGDFSESGKGNETFLNTFTWLGEDQRDATIEVLDAGNPQDDELTCADDSFDPPLDQTIYLKRKQNSALPIRVTLLDSESNIVTSNDLSMPPVVSVQYTPGLGGDGSSNSDLVPPGLADDGNAFSFNWDTMKWKIVLSTKQFTSPGQYDITIVSGGLSYTVDAISCSGRFVRME